MPKRDLISWNTGIRIFADNERLLDCVGLFKNMIAKSGFVPNVISVVSVLPVCASLENERLVSLIHSYVFKVGLDGEIRIGNALVDAYGKCGNTGALEGVFDDMVERNEVSWNSIIGGFSRTGLNSNALNCFRAMIREHVEINTVTIATILPTLIELNLLDKGKEIHGFTVKIGMDSDAFVANALVDMYGKSRRFSEASSVFYNIGAKNIVSWNTMIGNFAQNGLEFEALELSSNSISLFTEMEMLGLNLDTVSYMGVLSACTNMSAVKEGKQIHAFATRRLFHEHLFIANSFLDFYTKCGQIEIAKKLFDRIPKRDTASWNTMILGFGMLGEFQSSVDLFEAMKEDGVEYDSVSYIAVLSACSHGGLVERGKSYFNDMLARKNLEPSETHYACMVDLLGRCGLMEEAVKLINGMPMKPGANTWGALLGASRVHGNVELGFWAGENLLEAKPDNPGYYVVLSNMYAEAGRWEDADRVRKTMSTRRVKKNPGCSWVQVQDQMQGFISGERFDPYLS
ncbi:hypothetical protein MIMGU_mgv1a024216mg, partial [Erythranthe guttata]